MESGFPDFVNDAWTGVVAFAGQIFFDFAGYSTCAIGAALCLGFHLKDNFRFPYAAVGFSDFWRRWHISLSTFLRDFLYIPLGGNRSGPRLGVTGVQETTERSLPDTIRRLRSTTTLPICVGFGISTPAQARSVGDLADGVVVGSALVRAAESGPEQVLALTRRLREGLDG